VRRGRGVFATEFGSISYEPGDWVLMPKVTTFRQLPEAGDDLLLVIESPQPIRLCEHEQVGRHTPIDPTMLEVPDVADYSWPSRCWCGVSVGLRPNFTPFAFSSARRRAEATAARPHAGPIFQSD